MACPTVRFETRTPAAKHVLFQVVQSRDIYCIKKSLTIRTQSSLFALLPRWGHDALGQGFLSHLNQLNRTVKFKSGTFLFCRLDVKEFIYEGILTAGIVGWCNAHGYGGPSRPVEVDVAKIWNESCSIELGCFCKLHRLWATKLKMRSLLGINQWCSVGLPWIEQSTFEMPLIPAKAEQKCLEADDDVTHRLKRVC